MAVPKKKTSVSRKGMRRAGQHHKLYAHGATLACPNCGALALKHKVCSTCGYYKGKQIFTIKEVEDDETQEVAE